MVVPGPRLALHSAAAPLVAERSVVEDFVAELSAVAGYAARMSTERLAQTVQLRSEEPIEQPPWLALELDSGC